MHPSGGERTRRHEANIKERRFTAWRRGLPTQDGLIRIVGITGNLKKGMKENGFGGGEEEIIKETHEQGVFSLIGGGGGDNPRGSSPSTGPTVASQDFLAKNVQLGRTREVGGQRRELYSLSRNILAPVHFTLYSQYSVQSFQGEESR